MLVLKSFEQVIKVILLMVACFGYYSKNDISLFSLSFSF